MAMYILTCWHGGALVEICAAPCMACSALEVRGGCARHPCFPAAWLARQTPFFAPPYDVLLISNPGAACTDMLFGTESGQGG